jgi:hypothetical protein
MGMKLRYAPRAGIFAPGRVARGKKAYPVPLVLFVKRPSSLPGMYFTAD